MAQLTLSTADKPLARIFDLPVEIRLKIYVLAVPLVKWQIDGKDCNSSERFASCIGDPRGFFFALNHELALLRVNKQMRWETLPLAFRKTHFCFKNIESCMQILIAMNKIGRANIVSLELVLESVTLILNVLHFVILN